MGDIWVKFCYAVDMDDIEIKLCVIDVGHFKSNLTVLSIWTTLNQILLCYRHG